MRCSDVAMLLERLAHGSAGRTVEIGPHEAALLDRLIAEGLVAATDDMPAERAELERARQRMRELAASRGADAAGPEEKQLRARVLELSERLARSEGAVHVAIAGQGGPYRSTAAPGSSTGFRLTYRGRALLSDLAPRLARVGAMDVGTVIAEMEALRDAFGARAQRAAEILKVIGKADFAANAPELPLRSVAVGLATRNEPPAQVAKEFAAIFRLVREGRAVLSREQVASAAECLVIGSPGLEVHRRTVESLLALQAELLREHCRDRPEDALDASLLMIDADAVTRDQAMQRCIQVATEVQRQAGTPLLLSLALLVVRSGADHEAHTVARLAAAWRLVISQVAQPIDGIAVATLLALGSGGIEELVERWALLREYLGRFGSEAMSLPAALLALVDADVPETLDHLRLAATAIQQHRLAAGGAETTAHAVKLLLGVAVLAAGSEGDPEERLKLAPAALPRLPALGIASLAATLPMALQAVALFHRPMLSAAQIEALYHPVHDSYSYSSGYGTFGGGRGWG